MKCSFEFMHGGWTFCLFMDFVQKFPCIRGKTALKPWHSHLIFTNPQTIAKELIEINREL